ncbi:PilZ domain-containing protein [Acidobacteriota bacterium]
MSETKEKRREKRKSEENKVTISIVSKHKKQELSDNIYALTKDISMSGVKIWTDTDLQINTFLKIEMALAKSHRLISVIGKVKWIKQKYGNEVFEVGVEFVDTPPDRVMALLEHLYGQSVDKRSKD